MLLPKSTSPYLLTKTEIFSMVAADDFHEKHLSVSNLDEASWVMENLQSELDRAYSTKSTQYRRRCLNLMRYLNRSYGVLPPSMYLKDLVCESTTAVNGGGFADIWIGRWENQCVCVKVLRFFQRGSDRDKLLKDLSKEVLLWRQLKHPNILPFLGVNADLFSPSFCIISPWMSNGDVMSYSRRLSLDIRTRLEHTIQIAEGIAYLHGLDPPVVHGDIKGANILISDDCRCCLADFGLSVLDTQSINATHTATVQGSLRWLAPEFINPTPTPQDNQGKLTSRDIYAFGCTVFELLTGQPPFYHHNLDIKVAIDVLNGVRPVLSTDVVPNETIYKAICRMLDTCWSEQIMERPDAEGLLESLRRMQDHLQVPKIDWHPPIHHENNVTLTHDIFQSCVSPGLPSKIDPVSELLNFVELASAPIADSTLEDSAKKPQPRKPHTIGHLKRKSEATSSSTSTDIEGSRPAKFSRIFSHSRHRSVDSYSDNHGPASDFLQSLVSSFEDNVNDGAEGLTPVVLGATSDHSSSDDDEWDEVAGPDQPQSLGSSVEDNVNDGAEGLTPVVLGATSGHSSSDEEWDEVAGPDQPQSLGSLVEDNVDDGAEGLTPVVLGPASGYFSLNEDEWGEVAGPVDAGHIGESFDPTEYLPTLTETEQLDADYGSSSLFPTEEEDQHYGWFAEEEFHPLPLPPTLSSSSVSPESSSSITPEDSFESIVKGRKSWKTTNRRGEGSPRNYGEMDRERVGEETSRGIYPTGTELLWDNPILHHAWSAYRLRLAHARPMLHWQER